MTGLQWAMLVLAALGAWCVYHGLIILPRQKAEILAVLRKVPNEYGLRGISIVESSEARGPLGFKLLTRATIYMALGVLLDEGLVEYAEERGPGDTFIRRYRVKGSMP